MANVFDTFPKTLRIGPYDWRIKLIPGLKDEKGEELAGQCDERGFSLEFNPDEAIHPFPLLAMETVLHEIHHAVFSVCSFQPGDTEERICTLHARMMTQIYRDNPCLLDWMGAIVSGTRTWWGGSRDA